MANKIKINTNTLNSDADKIRKELQKIQKEIKEMQQDVTQMNKMWKGSANAAFQKVFTDDINDLLAICASIDGMIKYEDTAVKEYNSCENKVSGLVSGISI